MPFSSFPKTVELKGGKTAVLRLLQPDDFDRLFAFFKELPEEDIIYLRHDVRDPDVIRRWTTDIDLDHVIPIVAVDEDRIVASGTLHRTTHGWMQHVGHIRLVVAPTHQRSGLGTLLARELVNQAEFRGLEKLQAHVAEGNEGAIRMFKRVGFEEAAVIKDLLKDRKGRHQNLVVLVNDVSRLSQVMEDWIRDSMIPGFRGSMEGYG